MVTADEKAAREKDDAEQREAVEGIIRLQTAAARTKYCEELTRCLTNHLETEQLAHCETKLALEEAQKAIANRDAEIRSLRTNLRLREEEYAFAQKEINHLMLSSATMSLGPPAFEELQFLKAKNAQLQAELRLKDSKLEQIRRRYPMLDAEFTVPHFAIRSDNTNNNSRSGHEAPQSSPAPPSTRREPELLKQAFQAIPVVEDRRLPREQENEKKGTTESTSSAGHRSDDQDLLKDPGQLYQVDDQQFGFAATAKFGEALRQLTLDAERRLISEEAARRRLGGGA